MYEFIKIMYKQLMCVEKFIFVVLTTNYLYQKN